jgi:hypothetical protein
MSILNQKNSRKQGAVGLGECISWLVSKGYPVFIPLSDVQRYDAIAEINGELKKIEVKTTNFKNKNGSFEAALRTCGGNRTANYIQYFDNKTVDYLFVVTGDGSRYFIPAKEVNGTTSITLCKKYVNYVV